MRIIQFAHEGRRYDDDNVQREGQNIPCAEGPSCTMIQQTVDPEQAPSMQGTKDYHVKSERCIPNKTFCIKCLDTSIL